MKLHEALLRKKYNVLKMLVFKFSAVNKISVFKLKVAWTLILLLKNFATIFLSSIHSILLVKRMY